MKQMTENYNLLHVGAAPDTDDSPDRLNRLNPDRLLLLARRLANSPAVPARLIRMVNRMQYIIRQMSELINTNECAVQIGEDSLDSRMEDLLQSAGEFEKLFSMVSGSLDDLSNLAALVRGLLEKLLEYSSFDAFSSSISAAAPAESRPPEGVHASPGQDRSRSRNKTHYQENKGSKATGEGSTSTALDKRKNKHELFNTIPKNKFERERFFSTTEKKIHTTVGKSLSTLPCSSSSQGKFPTTLPWSSRSQGKLSTTLPWSSRSQGKCAETQEKTFTTLKYLTEIHEILSEAQEKFAECHEKSARTLKKQLNYNDVESIYSEIYNEINALNPGKSVVVSTAACMAGSVFKPDKSTVRF